MSDWKDSYQEYKWEREAEKKAHQAWLDAGAIVVPIAKVLTLPKSESLLVSAFGPYHNPHNRKDRT